MKDKAKDDKDAKRDDKAEKAGKEVAKDVKYDKRKHPEKDGKEVTKDIEYDEWKEKKMPSISRIKKMCKDGCTQAKILKLHPKCDKQKLKDMIKFYNKHKKYVVYFWLLFVMLLDKFK